LAFRPDCWKRLGLADIEGWRRASVLGPQEAVLFAGNKSDAGCFSAPSVVKANRKPNPTEIGENEAVV
jgi:hypothetical protein